MPGANEVSQPYQKVFRVLFVCLGNICRSPTAEGIFRHLVQRNGLSAFYQVASAGTAGYHVGEPPDARTCAAAARRGYRLESRAQQAALEHLDQYDLVVAMDGNNRSDLLRLAKTDAHRAKIATLLGFLPNAPVADVPDPYYGGPDGFERVLDLVEAACEALLNHLEEKRLGRAS